MEFRTMKYLKLFENNNTDITYENVKKDILHFIHDFGPYWSVQADQWQSSDLRRLLNLAIQHGDWFELGDPNIHRTTFPFEGFELFNKLIDLYRIVLIDMIVEESENDPEGYTHFLKRIPEWIKNDERLSHFKRSDSAGLWNFRLTF